MSSTNSVIINPNDPIVNKNNIKRRLKSNIQKGTSSTTTTSITTTSITTTSTTTTTTTTTSITTTTINIHNI